MSLRFGLRLAEHHRSMNSRTYAAWPHPQQPTARPAAPRCEPNTTAQSDARTANAITGDDRCAAVTTARRTDLPSRLMTLEEAADFLAVKPRWIYENHDTLAMPALRLGRTLRFRRDDLDAWLDATAAS
jgi:excisionase family DNA binding protein